MHLFQSSNQACISTPYEYSAFTPPPSTTISNRDETAALSLWTSCVPCYIYFTGKKHAQVYEDG